MIWDSNTNIFFKEWKRIFLRRNLTIINWFFLQKECWRSMKAFLSNMISFHFHFALIAHIFSCRWRNCIWFSNINLGVVMDYCQLVYSTKYSLLWSLLWYKRKQNVSVINLKRNIKVSFAICFKLQITHSIICDWLKNSTNFQLGTN